MERGTPRFELEFSKNLFPLFRKREYRVRFSVGKSVSIFIKVKEKWYLSKKKKEKKRSRKKRSEECMDVWRGSMIEIR